jgi:hypothetical protein
MTESGKNYTIPLTPGYTRVFDSSVVSPEDQAAIDATAEAERLRKQRYRDTTDENPPGRHRK